MKQEYIASVDQSTSATKACLFNRDTRIIGRATVEHRQYYPRPGWVEHNPVEIIANTRAAWDAKTGEPVHQPL